MTGESTWRRRVLTGVALAALAVTLVVFVRRLAAADEAAVTPPGTAQTSGSEEESMFALWRAARGLPIYLDVTQPPFAAAYFNWLFYRLYGGAVRQVLKAAPTVSLVSAGRWLTAAAALLGAGLISRRSGRRHPEPERRLACAALGAFLFLGPLVGWWAVTLRPDVLALLAETSGVLLFLAWHRDHPLRAVAAALAAFYGAWALKQIYVGGLAAVCVFLVAHRRWRDFGILAGGSLALWLFTLEIGGPLYRASLLDPARHGRFELPLGILHSWDAASRAAPVLLALAGWPAALLRHRPWRTRSPGHDALLLGTLGAPVAALLCFLLASKVGASGNYFFTPVMLLGIGTLLGAWSLEWQPASAALSCVLVLALQSGVLAGAWGSLSLPHAADLARRWAVFSTLPEPRFADDRGLDLPWLNPHSPPLVLAFNYFPERTEGVVFAGDGVGGMIRRGELASLFLPAGARDHYDRADLSRYRRGETVAGLTVYRLGPETGVKP